MDFMSLEDKIFFPRTFFSDVVLFLLPFRFDGGALSFLISDCLHSFLFRVRWKERFVPPFPFPHHLFRAFFFSSPAFPSLMMGSHFARDACDFIDALLAA